ncbi:AAA-like domain-containing protein [Leptolyngbya sp. AN03gr2]|uniref:AAA-like domain-containing protein n=1 Tax=unclassified Leptolyngbya TaxID=2650499 RepID=UPI003D31B118
MGRALQVKSEYLPQVKRSLPQHGYWNQRMLAEDAGFAQATVCNFLNGKPVDIRTLIELCHRLDLDVNEIAEPPPTDPPPEIEDQETEPPLEPDLPSPGKVILEFPTGLVRLDSPFYIARSSQEKQCYDEIEQVGALIRIKAPRQFGKTSLLVRVLDQAKQAGHRMVYLSLQEVDSAHLTDSATFLAWFYGAIASELELFEHINAYEKFAQSLGSKRACILCFEKYIFPNLSEPLTLGLDELDRILEASSVSADFFALLRVMNEKSKLGGIWQNFRLVLVHAIHAIEGMVPMDVNQSPFNVGLPIELTEFTSEQIQELAHRHDLNWQKTEVEQLRQFVGGMPFLVRLMLYHLATQKQSLAQVLQNEFAAITVYREYLERLERTIAHLDLDKTMRTIATSNADLSQVPLRSRYELHSLGLIKGIDDLRPRCELYRRYFCR